MSKIGHNLTTKRGDSGSAGLLERKCVINGALNLVTKIDQNRCQHQKLIKIHQKHKIRKSEKMRKSSKSQKPENEKTQKSTKLKSAKVKK